MMKSLPATKEMQVPSLGADGPAHWRREWQPAPVFLPGKARTSLSPGPLTFPKAAAASPAAPLGSQGGSVGSDAEPAAPHLSSVL